MLLALIVLASLTKKTLGLSSLVLKCISSLSSQLKTGHLGHAMTILDSNRRETSTSSYQIPKNS